VRRLSYTSRNARGTPPGIPLPFSTLCVAGMFQLWSLVDAQVMSWRRVHMAPAVCVAMLKSEVAFSAV
jgi:hypothetical protein